MEGYFNDLKKILIKKQEKKSQQVKIFTTEGGRGWGAKEGHWGICGDLIGILKRKRSSWDSSSLSLSATC